MLLCCHVCLKSRISAVIVRYKTSSSGRPAGLKTIVMVKVMEPLMLSGRLLTANCLSAWAGPRTSLTVQDVYNPCTVQYRY